MVVAPNSAPNSRSRVDLAVKLCFGESILVIVAWTVLKFLSWTLSASSAACARRRSAARWY